MLLRRLTCVITAAFALGFAPVLSAQMTLDMPKLPPEPVPFKPDFPHPGPIADADPSIRHHVALVVPGRLAVTREAKRLSVTINSEPHRRVDITVGKNMVIGEREDARIYEAGKPRPAESQRYGLTDLVEENGVATIDAIGTNFYNLSQDHFPEPGKTYIVEIKLTVFETKIPPQHMWMPRMDKVLWTGTLKTTVAP